MKQVKLSHALYVLAVIIVVLGIIWLIFPDGSNEQQKEQQVVKKPLVIIHQTWVGDAPMHLAKQLGYFEKYGVDAEIRFVEEPQERRALMASGRADIALETIDMAVGDMGSGVDLKIFALLDASQGADGIIATKDIQTLEDLVGKKVGAQKGEVPYFLLRYLMEKQNMDKSKVTFVDLFPDDAGAAFLAGELDAAGTWEPFLSKAKERSGGHVLVSSADAPGIIVDVMATRPEVLAAHEEEVKAVMNAWYDAIDYINEHPEESYALMAPIFDLSVEEFKEYVSGLKWNTLQESKAYFGTASKQGQAFDVTQTIADIAYEDGIVSKKLSAEQVVEPSLIQEI